MTAVLSASLANKVAAVADLLQMASRDHAPAALSSSLGAEDMALTDLIVRYRLPIEIFSLDTGRLPPQTYELLTRLEAHYAIRVKLYFPQPAEVEQFVAEYGINGFYQSIAARKACCQARKVEPLARALAGKRGWVTGLRAEQAITRAALQTQEWDAERQLMKINPLAAWTNSEVWDYLRAQQVPVNALHEQGYPSIGCAPCTRAVAPGEDQRAGRWWWEAQESRECGLHVDAAGRLVRNRSSSQPAANNPF